MVVGQNAESLFQKLFHYLHSDPCNQRVNRQQFASAPPPPQQQVLVFFSINIRIINTLKNMSSKTDHSGRMHANRKFSKLFFTALGFKVNQHCNILWNKCSRQVPIVHNCTTKKFFFINYFSPQRIRHDPSQTIVKSLICTLFKL